MNKKTDRRKFIKKSSSLGVACCVLPALSNLSFAMHDDKPDLTKRTYCGYRCTIKDCKLLRGTKENNIALKKESYTEGKWKEKYGIDFSDKDVFCHGCKPEDNNLPINIKQCTVRECALSKNIEACIECKELTDCNKELWVDFPKFKQRVLKLQEKYFAEDQL